MFSQPQELRWCNLKLAPRHRGQGEMEEGGSHPRLVGGGFNKPGSFHPGHVLSAGNWSRALHLPTRILHSYLEALTRLGTYTAPGSGGNVLSDCNSL